jgi:predicted nucleotidyltransferase
MTIKEQVNVISKAFAGGLRRILGNKLYGVYIYGAAAFPDDVPTGDIDFHVILNDLLTGDERLQLEKLHDTLGRDFPPLGAEMDGYYILLADARRPSPPRSEMWARATDNSWALHRAHIRAGRVLVLHGPEPKEVYPPATWSEIERALELEFEYVVDHLDQYPDYCILQLCRLVYSYETRDIVVSKAQASDWASNAFPEWAQHIELARKSYAHQATSEDRQFMQAEVRKFLEFACMRIANAK